LDLAVLKHLAIILDGNRRWAKERDLPSLEGHRRGYDRVKEISIAALERGIEHFTVYAFSTENWGRSKGEVDYLMELLEHALTADIDFFIENAVRLNIVGDRAGLRESTQAAVSLAEERTAHLTRGQFNLCVNYGGRAELLAGVKSLMSQGLAAEDLTEEQIARSLWSGSMPEPEMIVRTSGENRLSGFLTWAGVYSELLFLDRYWPDFTIEDLDFCLEEYAKRQRRYGQ
jgi:undecaprenyl diphosphate synthase